jgi:hypothetical protein
MDTAKALLVQDIFDYWFCWVCLMGNIWLPGKILSWGFEIGCKRHLAVILSKQKTTNVNGNRTINGGYEDLIKVTNL